MTYMSFEFLQRRSWTKWFLLFLLFFAAISSVRAQQAVSPGDVKMQEYNRQALMLINMGKLDEARPLIGLALKERENSASYYYLCHINAVEHHWKQAIEYGEKTISMDPNYLPVYPDIFYCYTRVGKWKKAEAIVDQVRKADEKNDAMIAEFEVSLQTAQKANILISVFLLLLGAAFALPFIKKNDAPGIVMPDPSAPRLSELFILSAAVSGIFWIVFFSCSEWIWSRNPHISAAEFTPSLRVFINEHDGVESFVLYMMMLANIAVSLILTHFLLRLRSNRGAYLAVCTALFAVAAYYFYNISFVPPMMQLTTHDGVSDFGTIFALVAILSIGGYFLYDKFGIAVKAVILLLLAASCLVMILPSSPVDLSFVLYPGLRMFYGAKVSEIYFQYDLFLSYLALLWFKLDYSLASFAYLGQVSFFLFFAASFLFADKFFKSKGLAVVFILAMLILRYYAIWEVTVGVFQVSPVRLDLWIIPLIVAYHFGLRHWLTGVSLGLLVLFHRNLGLIYLGSYIQLLLVLFVAQLATLAKEKNLNGRSFAGALVSQVKGNAINLVIIGASIALCFVLFKEIFSPSALVYRKLGVGMLQISGFSFYWYVPVALTFVGVYVFMLRDKLGEKYTTAALFIILLTIGESMYFYGRSHENNILNIAGALVLVLFIVFDLIISQSPEPAPVATPAIKGKKDQVATPASAPFLTQKRIAIALPFLFLFASAYYYSGRISEKYEIQSNNFKESQYICPMTPMPIDTTAIRQITKNSPNLYFLDFSLDFYYYYYGHYVPQGYFNPLEAWIYKKDLLDFLQNLLDKHYYIVYNARAYNSLFDYVPYLKYNQSYQKNDMIAIAREDVRYLLDEAPAELHVAMKDTIALNGQQYAGLKMNDDFTIEVVVKPSGQQLPTASLFSNFNRVNQLKGFTIQSNNGNPGQYVFALGAGQAMPTAAFMLEDNQWHYLVVVINKELIKIFDNGRLVGNVNTGGAAYVSSDGPLTVGNTDAYNGHFRGFIRELRIANGNMADADIIARAQKVTAELSGK